MLKTIPPSLSPTLLKILCEMGHGDEIVLGDGNFPGASNAKRLVNYNSSPIPPLLGDILQLFPLDAGAGRPVALMQTDDGSTPPIWKSYAEVVRQWEPAAMEQGFDLVERFAFYARAKNAHAVIQTGEGALYANIILKKGVVER